MSISIQLPQHFNFDDLVSEARAGRFNPEAFVQSVALDMSQTQFVGIGAAACLKALALRFQDGWPEGECLAMRHGGHGKPPIVEPSAMRVWVRVSGFLRWRAPGGA